MRSSRQCLELNQQHHRSDYTRVQLKVLPRAGDTLNRARTTPESNSRQCVELNLQSGHLGSRQSVVHRASGEEALPRPHCCAPPSSNSRQ
ncbi:UNVERIFIED_CONTAM: hypothetical protein Slati_2918500 [Sesamum latifolium]|uniref:Uncharacterized protein n=1 Tax=Sesamum latifolium TaxID=2727402 RepID=A0AAW2VDE4_9LAMI